MDVPGVEETARAKEKIALGLPAAEADAVGAVVRRLSDTSGVVAVVLGGSRAVGRHREDSDVDLGVYYCDEAELDVAALRQLASEVDDGDDPVVTEPWHWGRWVNGGAWLRIAGRRVDWIYRRTSHVETVLHALRRGEVEIDWMQQPPFGFASLLYAAETAACVPLHDDGGRVAHLKDLVHPYPEPLRRSIVQDWTWAADFALRKGSGFAARGDVSNTVACRARAIWLLAHVLHALARRWCFPADDVVHLAARLDETPPDFEDRANAVCAAPGSDPTSLATSLQAAGDLLRDVSTIAGDLYRAPRFPL